MSKKYIKCKQYKQIPIYIIKQRLLGLLLMLLALVSIYVSDSDITGSILCLSFALPLLILNNKIII